MARTDDRSARGSADENETSRLGSIADAARDVSEVVDLDTVDMKILHLLAGDSRLSQRALARELHMSPPAISDRVARMERLGVIRGYTIDVDWGAIDFQMEVFISVTATSGQAEIMESLHGLPEVEEVSVVTGSFDLLARLRVRNHAHLRSLMTEHIWQLPGVARTETMISLAEMPPKNFVLGLIGQRLQEK